MIGHLHPLLPSIIVDPGLGRNADMIVVNNWLRPSLPALRFSQSDLLPVDWSGLCRNDIPISLYRHMRVLGALGEVPRTHQLPVAAAAGLQLNDGQGSSTVGPYRGEFSAIYWNSQAFFCSCLFSFVQNVEN